MGNPVKGMLKRLAKWLVKHGLEEAQKELERERGGPAAGSIETDYSRSRPQPPQL